MAYGDQRHEKMTPTEDRKLNAPKLTIGYTSDSDIQGTECLVI